MLYNSINKDVESTISRLKFLSRVEKGDKINIKTLSIERNSNWWSSMKRFVFSENRNTCFEFIQTTFNQAFDVLISTIQTKNAMNDCFAVQILSDIQNAKTGVGNLQHTYENDHMYASQLSVLIESADRKTQDLISNHSFLKSYNVTTDSHNQSRHDTVNELQHGSKQYSKSNEKKQSKINDTTKLNDNTTLNDSIVTNLKNEKNDFAKNNESSKNEDVIAVSNEKINTAKHKK